LDTERGNESHEAVANDDPPGLVTWTRTTRLAGTFMTPSAKRDLAWVARGDDFAAGHRRQSATGFHNAIANDSPPGLVTWTRTRATTSVGTLMTPLREAWCRVGRRADDVVAGTYETEPDRVFREAIANGGLI
jgi:hypothetical protein